MGDVNYDGVPDFVVGAPGNAVVPCCLGNAYVFSGVDGSIIHSLTGPGFWSRFGDSVAGLGDVDGDLIDDFAIFVPGAIGSAMPNPLGGFGQTRIFSGASGQLILTMNCAPQACPHPFDSTSNPRVYRTGDIDGDGSGDFMLAPVVMNGINLMTFSGRTGTPLVGVTDPTPLLAGQYATFADWVGDIDGDGADEIIISRVGHSFTSAPGQAFVYSLVPQGVTVFGTNCAGASGIEPRIGAAGRPAAGSTFTLNLSSVAPNLSATLLVGLSDTSFGSLTLPFNVGPPGFPCNLLVSVDALLPSTSLPFGPLAAAASLSWTFPPSPPLTGSTLFGQWLIDNPPGAFPSCHLSRAVRVDFQ